MAVGITFTLDNQIAQRQAEAESERIEEQAILENLRFIRDRSADPESYKPFGFLNLQRVDLSELRLGCASPELPSCAVFDFADLTDAGMYGTDLQNASLFAVKFNRGYLHSVSFAGAHLAQADFTGAQVNSVDFTGADLGGANLTDADFGNSDLTNADLFQANLRGADLTEVKVSAFGSATNLPTFSGTCYDAETTWPDGVEPPDPSDCTHW